MRNFRRLFSRACTFLTIPAGVRLGAVLVHEGQGESMRRVKLEFAFKIATWRARWLKSIWRWWRGCYAWRLRLCSGWGRRSLPVRRWWRWLVWRRRCGYAWSTGWGWRSLCWCPCHGSDNVWAWHSANCHGAIGAMAKGWSTGSLLVVMSWQGPCHTWR